MAATTTMLFSCGNGSKQTNGATVKTDSTGIELPPATAIPTAEMKRLQNGCKAWFDSSLRSRGFNGGILVAKNGNIVFEAYTGTRDVTGGPAVDSLTPFHIASVSKTFTAMVVLKMYQDSVLKLDEEFSKYFPQFNYPGVTIRNLLNHRSGLPNYVYFMEKQGWDEKKPVTNQDVLDFLVQKKSSLTNIAPPETHFSYCNTNYALLALLIEKISGMKYADYLQQKLFKPLHLQHTFVYNGFDPHAVPMSYDWRGSVFPFTFLDAVYGDKNIYSTVRDLLLWDRALRSGRYLSKSTLDEAYSPYSNERAGIRNYGLGWRMNCYPNGKKLIYHNGWWHGNNASFVRLIDENATIIVTGNKFNRNIYHAKEMAALFGNYEGSGEEEESTNSNDHINPFAGAPLPQDSILFLKKKMSGADSALAERLYDRNKKNMERLKPSDRKRNNKARSR